MTRHFLKALLAPVAALAATCALPAQAQEDDPYAFTQDYDPAPAIWELSDEDTTIYLFGTVHFLPEGLDWFTPQIEAALTASDQFVTEIDTSAIPEVVPGEAPPPEAMAIAQMQVQLAQLTSGGTLRELMTEEDRTQYEAAMADAGITLTAPEIAENGNTVPIEVSAPGAEAILVLAMGNPTPGVAQFNFGPLAASQFASTRIRLAGTQDVVAIAKMKDGSFARASRNVKVTIGGCGG